MKQKLKICFGCKFLKKIWKNIGGQKYCQSCAGKLTEELTKPDSIKQTNNRQYPMASRSLKRAEQEKQYSIQRKAFLIRNPTCKMKIIGLCKIHANTIQHLKGRIGDLLLNEEFWMSACWPCHQYADTHPEEALENGWALLRLSK